MNLKEHLIKKIKTFGEISFFEFMQEVLYNENFGYYTRGKLYRDYFTASPLKILAESISNWVCDVWRSTGCKNSFYVVELGAGKGVLAKNVLEVLRKRNIFDSISFLGVEKSKVLREALFSNIKDFGGTVCDDSEFFKKEIFGCIYSNELFDSFPVRRVIIKDKKIFEKFVSFDETGFIEVEKETNDPEIFDYIFRFKDYIPISEDFEVNLLARRWVRNISKVLKSGSVLTIDYGFFNEPIRSTIVSYYKGILEKNFYIRLGDQDITSHINFSDLIIEGEKYGLKCEFIGPLYKFCQRYVDLQSYFKNVKESERLLAKNVIFPIGIGITHKVLIQRRVR